MKWIIACLLSCLVGSVNAAEKRPNIVFAFADDLGRYASAYRDAEHPSPNDLLQTPHFDRLAREGAIFQNAFVSAPSCTPSRAAILAGRHFFRNGSHAQLHHPWVKGYPDPWDSVQGFPRMLQQHGYHIGWTYKLHLSPDRLGGAKRNYQPAGKQFNRFSQQVMRAADPELAKAKLLNEVRENFQAFLADRRDDQPFFYWFNPTNTHRAWAEGSAQKLWGLDPEQLKGKLPRFLPDHPTIRQDFADYLGEAMAFDAAVGVLLDELQQRGELDETLVVVSGDHGAPGFPRGKCNLYDFGTRVLLAMRWPKHIDRSVYIDVPVSLIDLAPTFLAAAGLAPSSDMNGQNLLPILANHGEPADNLRGFAVMGRETHVDVARKDRLPYPMRGIRTDEYLYIINFKPDRWPVAVPPLRVNPRRRMDIDFGPTRDFFTQHEDDSTYRALWQLGFGKRPAEELYAVNRDPQQMTNLAQDPAYAETRQQLRQQLLHELRVNQDPRVIGDGDAFDQVPYVQPK